MIDVTPEFLVTSASTIEGVLKALERSGRGIVMVVDSAGRLEGILTDHDLRKALLTGARLETAVGPYVNRSPVVARVGTPRDEVSRIMRVARKEQLPLLDEVGRPVALETLSMLLLSDSGRHEHAVVIMAGGQGTRLRPLTNATPKPLLPIGEKPLLRIILEELKRYGFRRIFVALHYGGDQIEEHFGDGGALGLEIRYFHEPEPLGTAGALTLLPPPARQLPFLVMNGDLLTRVNLQSLLSFHIQNEYPMTMCVRQHGTEIPFGVVELRGSRVMAVHEKPQQVCFINAGIYVLNGEVIDLIPSGRRYDMTELVNAAADRWNGVGSFPIHEYWLDIGCPTDYERAYREYQHHF